MVIIMVMRRSTLPRVMQAGEFKAKCLQAMDEVAATGESIVVTKRGRAVVQIAPVATKPKTLRGFMRGKVKTGKDIISPIRVSWNAARS
jgi:prevent-host-death family protein